MMPPPPPRGGGLGKALLVTLMTTIFGLSLLLNFWLLTVTFGNILVAFLAPLQATMALSQFFWVFTSLMAVAAVIFAVLAYFYKGKSYLQPAASH